LKIDANRPDQPQGRNSQDKAKQAIAVLTCFFAPQLHTENQRGKSGCQKEKIKYIDMKLFVGQIAFFISICVPI